MPYIVLAYDATDDLAPERRMNAREAHLAYMDQKKAEGVMTYGAALLDDNEKMIGSIIVTEFEHRKDIDAWLAEEPYILNKVWDDITILPCKPGPSFAKKAA